jgi:hypothetical protein
VAFLEMIEGAGEAAEGFRHGEQAQRVGGRGGIHDDFVAMGLPRQPHDLQPGHQLVGAGDRQVEEALDVSRVQVGPTRGDLTKGIAMFTHPSPEGGAGGQLGGEEGAAARGDEAGRMREAQPKGVAEGGGGIGGDGEYAVAGFRCGQTGGGGQGRLAGAPFAAEQAEGRKRSL